MGHRSEVGGVNDITIFVLSAEGVTTYVPNDLADAAFIAHQATDDGHFAVDNQGRKVLPDFYTTGGAW